MLCGMREAYEIVEANQTALGAFTVVSREEIQGTISAAEELGVPVILQASPFQLEAAGLYALAAEMRHEGERARVPVVVHLDHAREVGVVLQALRAGFTSVMIDGSLLAYDENAALTRRVVEIAHAVGIGVEGEIGHVGGTEDDVTTVSDGLTDPDQAQRFVEETGVDALAVAIGTAHGAYKSEPHIDFQRLQAIDEQVGVPLVLHGGSTLSDGVLERSISLGIRKINIGTELKMAHTDALRRFFQENPDEFDPRKYLGDVREAVRRLVLGKLTVFSDR